MLYTQRMHVLQLNKYRVGQICPIEPGEHAKVMLHLPQFLIYDAKRRRYITHGTWYIRPEKSRFLIRYSFSAVEKVESRNDRNLKIFTYFLSLSPFDCQVMIFFMSWCYLLYLFYIITRMWKMAYLYVSDINT